MEFGEYHYDVICFYSGEEEGKKIIENINNSVDEICSGDPDFQLYFLSTGEDKIDFTCSSCEICGSTLAGERIEAVFARL